MPETNSCLVSDLWKKPIQDLVLLILLVTILLVTILLVTILLLMSLLRKVFQSSLASGPAE